MAGEAARDFSAQERYEGFTFAGAGPFAVKGFGASVFAGATAGGSGVTGAMTSAGAATATRGSTTAGAVGRLLAVVVRFALFALD